MLPSPLGTRITVIERKPQRRVHDLLGVRIDFEGEIGCWNLRLHQLDEFLSTGGGRWHDCNVVDRLDLLVGRGSKIDEGPGGIPLREEVCCRVDSVGTRRL